ncbi:uncharacterized protein DS421_1g11680 [Arachis hypogaea]|nr:uncharacterized protein DS421_1g11680 [Arachis hypogaea]
METIQATPDYYCVFAGWVPGIYNSFDDVQEQIRDFHGPSWAKFATLENADNAWVLFFGEGDYDRGINLINNGYAPEPVSQDHHRDKQRVALQALHERFRHEEQVPLPRYLRSEDLASQKPANALLLSLSMRNLLTEVCDKLDTPEPLYRAITKTSRDGRTCYRHLASLVPPTSPDALVESGRIAFNEETSVEDAARMTLRALCATLDVVVYDYNYDIVQTLTNKYANLANDYRNILRKEKTTLTVSDSAYDAPEQVFDLDAITYRSLGASTSIVTPDTD